MSRSLLTVLSPATAASAFTRVSCIRTRNAHDCIDKIRANKADAVSLDAGDVYSAVKLYGLSVVAKEIYAEGNCVFAVAVARRGTLNVRGLKGTRSCHNGARWTSGWNVPLSFLLAANDLVWDRAQPLGHAVADYFNASCAPGIGLTIPRLCALCQGQKSYLQDRNDFCETNGDEPFYDSDGAFRCLTSGVGEVAFLDHLAIINTTDSDPEDYELLCPDGSVAPLTAYGTCNLGRGPGRAVVARRNFQKIARKFITTLQHLFGEKGKEKTRFELFASALFRGKNLLFRDAAHRLELVGEQTDVGQVLGLDYVALLQGLGHEGSSLSHSLVRWCCISDAELRKCEEWALNVRSDPLVCVQADSVAGCIKRIKKNEADAVTLDAAHAYFAESCALVPVAVEYYGPEPLYAIALAKADPKNLNLRNLRGKRSCHGYEFSPAGWLLLSRYLLRGPGNRTSVPCDLSSAYQDFFWKGCMPGAGGKLCKVCVGQKEAADGKGTFRCAASHNERYYGNLGALRCLSGDPSGRSYGDVAFLEHYNLLQNIEYLSGSGWAPGSNLSDFELLCPNGSRAALSDWRECNLGRVPASVVVTRPVTVTKIHAFLAKSQDANSNSPFQLFRSQKYGESDLLFKDATRQLILTRHPDYRAILGGSFFQFAESVFSCTPAAILDFCKEDYCTDSSPH